MTLPRITAGDRDEIVASIKSIMRRYPLGARTFGKFAAIARAELTQETIGLAVAEEAGGARPYLGPYPIHDHRTCAEWGPK